MRANLNSGNTGQAGRWASKPSAVKPIKVHHRKSNGHVVSTNQADSVRSDRDYYQKLWSEVISGGHTEEVRACDIDDILEWGNNNLSGDANWDNFLVSSGEGSCLTDKKNTPRNGEIYCVVSVEDGYVFKEKYQGTLKYDERFPPELKDRPIIHEFETGIISDSEGLIFRRISRRTDENKFTSYEDELVVKPDDYKSYLEANKLLEVKKGKLFFVYDGERRNIITFGKYLGYHVDSDKNPVFWFDNGECIPANESLIFVEAKERSTPPTPAFVKYSGPISESKTSVKPNDYQQGFLGLAKLDEKRSFFFLQGQNLSNSKDIPHDSVVYILDIESGEVVGPVNYSERIGGKHSYLEGPDYYEITDSNGLLVTKMGGELKEDYSIDQSQKTISLSHSKLRDWKDLFLANKDQMYSIQVGPRPFFGRPRFVMETNGGVVIGLDSGEIIKLRQQGTLQAIPYKKKHMGLFALVSGPSHSEAVVIPKRQRLNLSGLELDLNPLDIVLSGKHYSASENQRYIIETAEKLGSSIVQDGQWISGRSLNRGDKISSIRASNGKPLLFAGQYIDKNERGCLVNNFLTGRMDELFSNNGIVFRDVEDSPRVYLHGPTSETVYFSLHEMKPNLTKLRKVLEQGIDRRYEIEAGKFKANSSIVGYNFVFGQGGSMDDILLWLGNGALITLNRTNTSITPV